MCSLLVFGLPSQPQAVEFGRVALSDTTWRLRRGFWVSLALVPAFLLLVTRLTVASHDKPLAGSHVRFGAEAAEAASR